MGKRKRVDLRLNPKVVEMIDAAAEKFNTTRTRMVELGACLISHMANEVLEAGVGE